MPPPEREGDDTQRDSGGNVENKTLDFGHAETLNRPVGEKKGQTCNRSGSMVLYKVFMPLEPFSDFIGLQRVSFYFIRFLCDTPTEHNSDLEEK